MSDDDDLNEDWLRTQHWDLYNSQNEPVTTVDDLLAILGSKYPGTYADRLNQVVTLPMWQAAPAALKTSVQQFLAQPQTTPNGRSKSIWAVLRERGDRRIIAETEADREAEREEQRVGPKGYIHGWIKVGGGGAEGDAVVHKDHGEGTITKTYKTAGGYKTQVSFKSGQTKVFAGAQQPKAATDVMGKAQPKPSGLTESSPELGNKAPGKGLSEGMTVYKLKNPQIDEKGGLATHAVFQNGQHVGYLDHSGGPFASTAYDTNKNKVGTAKGLGPTASLLATGAQRETAPLPAGYYDKNNTFNPDSAVSAYNKGYTVEKKLSGGQKAESVRILRLSNGQRVVEKKQSAEDVGNSVAAGKVANALGIPNQLVGKVDDQTTLHALIEGKTGVESAKGLKGDAKANALLSNYRAPGAREIGQLDRLTQTGDRHHANYIKQADGTVIPIDNALTFKHYQATLDSSPFAHANAAALKSDVASIRQKIASLKSDPSFSGKNSSRYQFLMNELKALEAEK